MTDIIELTKTLGGVGFPTLLMLIIYGSYKGIWVWGTDHRTAKAEWERRLTLAEARGDMWQEEALKWLHLGEDAAGILTSRTKGVRGV